MRSSIRDVAREAGVSHMTVANVLNGRAKRTSSDTRERVLQAARAMNYMPVAQPSTQRRHVETRIIGLVYDHLGWEDYWGLRTLEGLRAGAMEHGYDLLTILRHDTQRPIDQQKLRFLDRRSDGLIFLMPQGRDNLFHMLIEHEVPTVSCYIDDVPDGVASVVVDNHGAMVSAVRHLREHGHRRIMFCSMDLTRADFRHRYEGYRAAIAEGELEPSEFLVEASPDWRQSAAACIAARRPTAVVCSTDALALQVREMLLEMSLRIPEDISLMGMDDLPEARIIGLTTIRISGVEVGRQAMDAMISRIAGEEAGSCHRTIASVLVERCSVAMPAH